MNCRRHNEHESVIDIAMIHRSIIYITLLNLLVSFLFGSFEDQVVQVDEFDTIVGMVHGNNKVQVLRCRLLS